jgi:hypothetical protein
MQAVIETNILSWQTCVDMEGNFKQELESKLAELETIYADCLVDGTDPKVMSRIWIQIKAVRQQLSMPVYHFMTPKEFRQ